MIAPRIEQVWVFQRGGSRAIGAIVHAEMRRADHDNDPRPLRALMRVFMPNGQMYESWTPCETRDEARVQLEQEKLVFVNASFPWTEVPPDGGPGAA
jgi:hypothetical protein